eukprot:CAMPEP_0198282494 /NCGR_PEP_ID=MMETSP1449-20131203/2294_1 /TAXON_ID=420275 /ORGANISM="Attheya septentrionalis, Strain CCMP2084" /LENGTH=56 /DNA_ID=CAMNT_0043978759 /DNA_START=1 /DNA_END=167 /DNA_ORIENTATION=-
MEAKEELARKHWEEKQKEGKDGPLSASTRRKGLTQAILKTAQERDELELEAKEELA